MKNKNNIFETIEDFVVLPAARFVFNFKIRYLIIFLVIAYIVSSLAFGTPKEAQTANTLPIGIIHNRVFTIAAVGDISCSTSQRRAASSKECKDKEVLEVINKESVSHIILLGDLQYHSGTKEEFAENFIPTWGSSKSTLVPLLGNHEYYTKNASGFFHTFPDVPARGYYAFEHKGVKFINLNTNCKYVSCKEGSNQYLWLQHQLRFSNGKCVIASGHNPRYSSGPHGSSSEMKDLWALMAKHNVFAYFAGHDHHYERFTTKPIQIVSGSGGKKLRGVRNGKEGSDFINSKDFGSFFMRYDNGNVTTWFGTVDGRKLDVQKHSC
jgi:hypothetical protein